MRQRAKQRLVQQLVPEPSVEALDESVLARLPGGDVVPGDAAFVGPAQHGIGGQFGAVVRDDRHRLATPRDEVVELTRDPEARDRGIGDERQAFPRAVVDHRQDSEAPAIDHLIVHEIERPALVRRRGQRDRRPHAQGTFAPAAAPDHQPFRLVEPINALAVHDMPLAPQQYVKPPIAEAPALVRQLPQPLAQRRVRWPAWAVPHAGAIDPDKATGPPLAHAEGRLKMNASLPAGGGPYHFFASSSFSAAASNIASASSFFSRVFSASSVFNRRASDTSMPPYFAFQP